MKKFKKAALALTVIAMLTASLTGCGGADASETGAAKERNWKIGHVRPEGTSTDDDVRRFAENLNAKTEGMINLEIYPSSMLGNYTVVQERVGMGDIEMQLAPAGTSVDKGMGIASAPYLVANWDEAKVMFARDGKLVGAISDMFDKQNIKLIACYPKYFGGIALAKEPNAPKDIDADKGIKIRVPTMKAYEKTAQSLGFTATPIAYSEAFTSMQTGIVDGVIGSGAEGYYASFRDLTNYYLPLNDHFEMWFLYMSKDVWNKLSEDEQNAIMEAGIQLEQERFDVAEQEEQEFIDKLRQNGTVIYEYSDAELEAYAEKVKAEVWPEIKDEYGADLFDSIVE